MKTDMIQKIEAAFKEKPDHLGVRVGILCVRGEVPFTFVEGVVGTTLVSVYRWVTGTTKPQNKADVRKLERLIYTITQAIERGVLPAESKFDPAQVLPIWKESKDQV